MRSGEAQFLGSGKGSRRGLLRYNRTVVRGCDTRWPCAPVQIIYAFETKGTWWQALSEAGGRLEKAEVAVAWVQHAFGCGELSP